MTSALADRIQWPMLRVLGRDLGRDRMAIRVPPLKEVPWCSRMLHIHTLGMSVLPGGIKGVGSHACCFHAGMLP